MNLKNIFFYCTEEKKLYFIFQESDYYTKIINVLDSIELNSILIINDFMLKLIKIESPNIINVGVSNHFFAILKSNFIEVYGKDYIKIIEELNNLTKEK